MSAPAGWYDDGTGRQRWWDGNAWGVYAEEVSSMQLEARPVGFGQTAAPAAQSVKEPGIFNALGQAVKNAAAERKDIESVRSVSERSVFGKQSGLKWQEGGLQVENLGLQRSRSMKMDMCA